MPFTPFFSSTSSCSSFIWSAILFESQELLHGSILLILCCLPVLHDVLVNHAQDCNDASALACLASIACLPSWRWWRGCLPSWLLGLNSLGQHELVVLVEIGK